MTDSNVADGPEVMQVRFTKYKSNWWEHILWLGNIVQGHQLSKWQNPDIKFLTAALAGMTFTNEKTVTPLKHCQDLDPRETSSMAKAYVTMIKRWL